METLQVVSSKKLGVPMKNDPSLEKLCVIGLGYVGLPTAAIFANRGLNVLGVDINSQSVDAINAGKVPIIEPDLDILVNGAIAAGQFRAVVLIIIAADPMQ